MHNVIQTIWKHLINSIYHQKAWLLPLRLFLALGWLRASTEKVVSLRWSDGESLAVFLQTARTETPFGFYRMLIDGVFLPNIDILSFLVAAGQGAIGLALLFGLLSQAALLAAIFLNLNFILAGVVNPSAFYIMIELVLLSNHMGAIWGLDAYFSRYIKQPWLVAQARPSQDFRLLRFQMIRCFALAGLLTGLSLIDFFYIKTFSPETSVEDPAMLLYILALFSIFYLLIGAMQIRSRLTQLRVWQVPNQFMPPLAETPNQPRVHN